MNDLLTFLGLRDGNSAWYLFWSGIFGDASLFAAAGYVVRRHTCHVHRCWRVGLHHIGDSGVTVCRKHHPSLPDHVTIGHVNDLFERMTPSD